MTNDDLRKAIHHEKVVIPAKPPPPTIVIDSREKKPYTFNGHTATSGLPTGDYSIRGFEKDISVERKSLPDLYGCMTKELPRFFDQMDRLREIKCRLLLVEGTWDMVGLGKEIHPKSTCTGTKTQNVLLSVMSSGVPVFLANDRQHANCIASDFLERSYNKLWKTTRAKLLGLS